jgi:hypothetical protein
MAVTKKREPEYTLHIVHATDPDTSEAAIAFVVRTTREFVSFMYEIPLETKLSDRTIELRIRGLRVPENLVSGKGQARGVALLRKLKGEFGLAVTNVDGATNRFSVNVAPNEIRVKKLSRKPFIIYSAEPIHL